MNKKLYTEEELNEIRNIDLLTYLSNYEPDDLRKISRNKYGSKTYSSLTMTNGYWMYWAKRIGGKSALDFLVDVRGLSFNDATNLIYNKINSSTPHTIKQEKRIYTQLNLPPKNDNNDRILNYLCNERGLAKNIVNYYIQNNQVYECLYDHSVVFVNYDETETPKYACKRSIKGRDMIDVGGSNKRYCFSYNYENSKTLNIFECAIDLISYQTLLQLSGKTWYLSNYLSLGGVYKKTEGKEYIMPVALEQFLKHHDINTIIIHFDHDEVGRGAAIAVKELLEVAGYEVIDHVPPPNCDINDMLKIALSKNQQCKKAIPFRTVSHMR